MEIYDESMHVMEKPDLELGWLEESYRVVHHKAIEAVEEIWHYETVAQYPNGGKDVRKVIDAAGIKAQSAWDERIPIQIYHPYTQEELRTQPEEPSGPTTQERLERLEAEIDAISGRIDEMNRAAAAYWRAKGV